MRIKLLNDVNLLNKEVLKKDSEYIVRQVNGTNLLNQDFIRYQIIEGSLSGKFLNPVDCILVPVEDMKYTESQWKAQEDYFTARLKQEEEKTERAQEAVRNLTKQIVTKNQEIEKLTFFVEALTTSLHASCQAIKALRKAN